MIAATDIFGNTRNEIPRTEGIKYAGSKLKMLRYIIDIADELNCKSILDGFSGTTRVSQAFSRLGYEVTCSDISVWSETFGRAYLLNKHPKSHYIKLIEHLNSIEGCDGWFSQHYGGNPNDREKRPFQLKNTRRLDAIRTEIDNLQLDAIERSVALTSLIMALDSVDNTLGHYAAYLSEWSPRSYNDMVLQVPNLWINERENKVVRGDIFDTVRKGSYDLVYYDPPYGSNNEKMPPSRVRYNSYYHIWTSVILNDKPAVFGKANRREDSRDTVSASVFEEFRRNDDGCFIALEAIRVLLQETSAKYILLSYSSGGRATKHELHDILSSQGVLRKVLEIDYRKNVMSNMRWTNEWINSDGKHTEYLFLLEKR